MKLINALLLSVNLLAGALIIWLLSRGPVPALSSGAWSYSDLIAIILTALGVILSAVTLAVAIVAIWSFQNISKSAGSAAERTALANQQAYFESPAFQNMLDGIISERMENEERNKARARVELEGQQPAPNAADGDEPWAD